MSGTTTIVVFVASLILAIMLHEAGHFLTAKRFGIRADRFFLGFGPTLWSTQRGETEYGVKALPLGGFVRIKGMSDLDERRGPVADEIFDPERLAEDHHHAPDPATGDGHAAGGLPAATWTRMEAVLRSRGASRDLADRIVRRTRQNAGPDGSPVAVRACFTEVVAGELPESTRVGDLTHRVQRGDEQRFFADKPAWQRAIVLVAGSAVHFAIAIALMLGIFLFLPTQVVAIEPVVSQVLPDTPAEASGLEVGDELLAVEDTATDDYDVLRTTIQGRAGEPTELVVERDGEQVTIDVTPVEAEDPVTGETVGQVGFAPTQVTGRMPVDDAVRAAFTGPTGFFTQVGATFSAIGNVFGPEGLGSLFAQATGETERDATGAVSLVGAANVAGQTAAFGVGTLLLLIASVNVFIGVFNLLPLPPLDGGHLAVLGVERSVNAVRSARGKAADFTVDPRAVAAVAVPVLAVLGFVFVTLLWLDITSPIQLPS